jgi:hypothetical protein
MYHELFIAYYFFTFQHQMLPGMQGFLKKEKLFLAPLVICIVIWPVKPPIANLAVPSLFLP